MRNPSHRVTLNIGQNVAPCLEDARSETERFLLARAVAEYNPCLEKGASGDVWNLLVTGAYVKNLCVLLVMIVVASVSLSAQAGSKNEAPQIPRRHINLPKLVQAPFSDGVLVGNTLYVAGRIGLDPKTGKPPEDVEQEARNVLDGIKSVLGEAGMTMDDLVWVQVFCPDLSLYGKFNDVYKTYFSNDYPARAFVGSGPLLRGGHFEVNGIAVKR